MQATRRSSYALITALEICVGVLLVSSGEWTSNTGFLLVVVLLVAVGLFAVVFNSREVQAVALLFYGLSLSISLTYSPFSYLYDYRVRYVTSYWSVSPSDVVLVYLVVAALARAVREPSPRGDRRDLVLPVLFLLVHVASVLPAVNEAAAIFASLRILKFLFVYWYFSRAVTEMAQVRTLIAGLSVGAIVQFGIAVAQWLSNGYLGLRFLGEVPTAMRARWVDGVITVAPAGTFQHSNALALFSLLLLCMLLGLWGDSRTGKYTLGALAAVMLAIQLLAASRTVWVISLVTIYTAIVLWNRSRASRRIAQLLAISVPLAVLGAVFWDAIAPLLFSSDLSAQVQNRTVHWVVGWSEIAKSWLWGYGANNYADQMALTYPAQVSTNFFLSNPIHNTYLQYWFDLGIVGLVIMLCLHLRAVLRGFRYVRDGINPQIGAMAVLVVSAFMMYYFTGWGAMVEPMVCFFWIVSGLVYNEQLRQAPTGPGT